jgi:argininosuccinate synthase
MSIFESNNPDPKKVLLLYSGGLDTSCMVKWIQQHYGAEVVTLTLSLGQDAAGDARRKAIDLGAVRAHVLDCLDEFADVYLSRAIRANGLYQHGYPLSTALARPLVAERAVEIARLEGANAIAHGCTGKGNDQVRFEVSINALAPDVSVIAPVREWNMDRESEKAYALDNGIPVGPSSEYSIDANLWGRSIECGPLEDPYCEPPSEIFRYVVPPEMAPDSPEYVEIGFEAGLPVSLNGERMSLARLIDSLNGLSGHHGVGIIDHVEDRVVGLKSREVYECPAAVTILSAHADLERFCSTIHQNEVKAFADRKWSELVYKGLWHDPLRADLDALMDSVNETVTGKVRMKLFKGRAMVVGRFSENAVYDHDLATYGQGDAFDQTASKGFIDIWGLQTGVACRAKRARTPQPVRGGA